jgi:hypothetical protein
MWRYKRDMKLAGEFIITMIVITISSSRVPRV